MGAAVSKSKCLKRCYVQSLIAYTRFDADTSMATKGLLAFRAGIQNANKTWDELASDIRTMATVMGNMLKGAFIIKYHFTSSCYRFISTRINGSDERCRCSWWCLRNGSSIWYCLCWRDYLQVWQ